jgi:hypothetical protein
LSDLEKALSDFKILSESYMAAQEVQTSSAAGPTEEKKCSEDDSGVGGEAKREESTSGAQRRKSIVLVDDDGSAEQCDLVDGFDAMEAEAADLKLPSPTGKIVSASDGVVPDDVLPAESKVRKRKGREDKDDLD